MSTIVAIWNCTHPTVRWETKRSDERLRIFQEAAFRAHAEGLNNADPAADPRCILVAPEYTFAEPHTHLPQPAMQVTARSSQQIVQTIQQVSSRYPDVLFVPGTIAELANTPTQRLARNRCVAARAGVIQCDFAKRAGVGEVAPTSGVTFQPGTGYGLFTIGARTYGVQICSDATAASPVHLPSPVHVQIVTGQGIGHAAVHHQFLAVQIIADFNGSGVWRLTRGQPSAVPCYWRETTSAGGELTYYKV
jgi:hypothetical protein